LELLRNVPFYSGCNRRDVDPNRRLVSLSEGQFDFVEQRDVEAFETPILQADRGFLKEPKE
jgi:hypothetical protein